MTNNSEKTIAIVGATGNQGGSVFNHLSKSGWRIRAITRNESSTKSKKLVEQYSSTEIVQADLNDIDSMKTAFKRVYGVFGVTNFFLAGGPSGETQQGINIAKAAKESNVTHLIFSSVGSAHLNSGVPHFESKFKVEEYILKHNIPATVIRPVYIMENFIDSQKQDLLDGTLKMGLPNNVKLQMLTYDDIGGIIAKIFKDYDKFINKQIDIAGDELTIPEVVQKFSQRFKKDILFESIDYRELIKQNEDLGKMYEFFKEKGYSANIEYIKGIYPNLTSFDEWLEKISLD